MNNAIQAKKLICHRSQDFVQILWCAMAHGITSKWEELLCITFMCDFLKYLQCFVSCSSIYSTLKKTKKYMSCYFERICCHENRYFQAIHNIKDVRIECYCFWILHAMYDKVDTTIYGNTCGKLYWWQMHWLAVFCIDPHAYIKHSMFIALKKSSDENEVLKILISLQQKKTNIQVTFQSWNIFIPIHCLHLVRYSDVM